MNGVYDVIVVGAGGAMGSSACLHLARRGLRVLGLEQFELGHTRGSSHGCSRMIRMCYYEHPDYVPLLCRAYALWDELVEAAGAEGGTIFKRTGGVYMGPAGCEAVEGSRRSAELHGLDHEMLGRAELARRFPQFRVGDDFVALYEPMAGYLVPEAVIATQMRLAREAGAEIRFSTPMTGMRFDGGMPRVATESEEFQAAKVVLTTGAWARYHIGIGSGLVTPTRQVLGWVEPRRAELFEEGVLPVWAIDAGHLGEGLYYGFPMLHGPHQRPGLKLARHARGPEIRPDDPSRDPRPDDDQTFRPCLRRWMSDADGPTLSTLVCVYENSPDGHFIIDRHPAWPNTIVACGFSGHGFKFASVVGEVVAGMVEGGTGPEFLGLERFGATP